MRQRSAPIPAAAVAFVRDTGRGIEVYLSRRPEHFRYFPGAFVFPGGRADLEDFDLRETARREVKEEIGVDIDTDLLTPLRETQTSAHAGPVYHLLTFAYPVEGELVTSINPDEVEEEIWITPREALDRLDLPYQIGAAVYTMLRFGTVRDLVEGLSAGSINEDFWF
jgi:8-oxo-dGTP pyrophosphatase MutT (NUDIX family)